MQDRSLAQARREKLVYIGEKITSIRDEGTILEDSELGKMMRVECLITGLSLCFVLP